MTKAARITRILEGLSDSGQIDHAWSKFLDGYSARILRVVHQFEGDDGRAADCFLYVCGKLSDDGFRRLLSYRPEGPARFRTWLSAVAVNLCIDWRRKEYGSLRPLKAVAALPALDRAVFRALFELGMTRRECLHALDVQFPGVTEQRISEINGRLFCLLTSRQRWRLGLRSRNPVSLNDALALDPGLRAPAPEAPLR